MGTGTIRNKHLHALRRTNFEEVQKSLLRVSGSKDYDYSNDVQRKGYAKVMRQNGAKIFTHIIV